ncbi:hypothetical protein M080_2625 [Bacteroides fragilis str. 3397 T10]|nr:hypothetical protein M080_2625 [Bacteroides fragilis str. 3397 T10]EYA43106.1 hypothetical protein M110_2903 [Bacteroides fragilis str. 3397 N3]
MQASPLKPFQGNTIFMKINFLNGAGFMSVTEMTALRNSQS